MNQQVAELIDHIAHAKGNIAILTEMAIHKSDPNQRLMAERVDKWLNSGEGDIDNLETAFQE